MLDLFSVSIRNVGRNKRRTAITIITIVIGVVVVIGARGLLNGLQSEIRSGLTRKVHGDLQIHKKGYQDSLDSSPYKMMMPFTAADAAKIKEDPRIQSVAPRLRVMALLNHQKSQTSTPVMVSGIDSAAELAVCPRLTQAVQSGKMIDSSLEQNTASVDDANLDEAIGLDDGAPGGDRPVASAPKSTGFHQILVTPTLMRGLDAKLGDEIVLLIPDKNNMQQALIATLTGVVDYGLPNGGARMAWLDFNTLQKAVGVVGLASEIAIRTTDGIDENLVAASLRKVVPEDQVVETWLELGAFFRDVMATQNSLFTAVLGIIFIIMISAIVNTSLMTVMERTREIGTLMALGYRRNHILVLFLGESATIGFGGGIAGILFATLAVNLLGAQGMNFTITGSNVPTILYPWVGTNFLGLVLSLATGSALIAGLIPAYRASRLKPVEALTSN